ncbi:MAG: site-specific integrase [Marinomonas sp.]
MRAQNRLSASFVKNASVGKHCDGAGLWLVKRIDGGAQSVLRVTVHGRRREMGLGGFPTLGLAEARKQAARWRAVAAENRDPIKEREAEERAARREDISLAVITEDAFEARKAMNRIAIVMKHAAALGLDVDLQATEKAKALLGKTRHVPKHIPAMAWADVPAFYATLEEPTLTHLALRLLILTGVRSGPLRNIRQDQIAGEVWTGPAENMKGRKSATEDFRVPLSDEAQRVIDLARPHARNGYLFPNTRSGVISDMTLSRHLERRGLEARPHGFRTSLRTWLAEATDAPHEVAEAMLAHVTDGNVVRAYRRTDFLEQRTKLAARWADHATGGTGQVVNLAGPCDGKKQNDGSNPTK